MQRYQTASGLPYHSEISHDLSTAGNPQSPAGPSQPDSGQKPAIWAALTPASIARGGEFTTTSKYSRSHHLCRQDITMATNRSYFTLTIKASKTDPYRVSCRLPVAATHTITCPVRAMRAFLRSRRHSSSLRVPLFTLHSGKYLTRSHLTKIMRGLLQAAGLTPTQASQYSSHSLRQPQRPRRPDSPAGSSRRRAAGKVRPTSDTSDLLRRPSLAWRRHWPEGQGDDER